MKNKIRSFATGYQNCCRQVLKTRLILTQGFDIITSHKLWLSAAVLSLNMIVSGCGGGKANVDTEDENIVCLTGTPVSTDDDLYVFDICAATDTVLYGQAALQPFFVEKFRLSGSEAVLTDSLGRKGNGPEEMSSAQCCFDSKNNKLYLWSPTDLRCYSYDLNEASLQPNALNVLYNQLINCR